MTTQRYTPEFKEEAVRQMSIAAISWRRFRPDSVFRAIPFISG